MCVQYDNWDSFVIEWQGLVFHVTATDIVTNKCEPDDDYHASDDSKYAKMDSCCICITYPDLNYNPT